MLNRILLSLLIALLLPLFLLAQQTGMMVRIAEIEIDSTQSEAYMALLKEEAAASVKLEPGVTAIFPMTQKEHPYQVRILEVYADRQAYEAHLKTPHFLKYKNGTAKMVKALRLVDMNEMDAAAMKEIFRKMR